MISMTLNLLPGYLVQSAMTSCKLYLLLTSLSLPYYTQLRTCSGQPLSPITEDYFVELMDPLTLTTWSLWGPGHYKTFTLLADPSLNFGSIFEYKDEIHHNRLAGQVPATPWNMEMVVVVFFRFQLQAPGLFLYQCKLMIVCDKYHKMVCKEKLLYFYI